MKWNCSGDSIVLTTVTEFGVFSINRSLGRHGRRRGRLMHENFLLCESEDILSLFGLVKEICSQLEAHDTSVKKLPDLPDGWIRVYCTNDFSEEACINMNAITVVDKDSHYEKCTIRAENISVSTITPYEEIMKKISSHEKRKRNEKEKSKEDH